MTLKQLKTDLYEHRKHCTAKKRRCPYEADAVKVYLDLVKKDREDELGVTKVQSPENFRKRMNKLVNRLLEGGWSDEIGNDIMKAVDDVKNGRAKPVRMPGDTMTKDTLTGFPNWFLSAYHMATATDTKSPDPESVISEKVNEVVEKVLKGLGVWKENIYRSCIRKYGRPFASGSESVVFSNGKDKVAKASTLAHTKNVIVAMERLMLSNIVFPEAAQTVVAMGSYDARYNAASGRANNPISFELGQPKFKLSYFRTEGEVDKALKKLGFVRSIGDDFQSENGELRLLDCKRINVPHDRDGNVLMIDAAVTLENTATGIYRKPLEKLTRTIKV